MWNVRLFHTRHVCHRWSLPELLLECLNGRRRSASDDLHLTARQVLRPAHQAQLLALALREPAEPNALDLARDNPTHGYLGRCRHVYTPMITAMTGMSTRIANVVSRFTSSCWSTSALRPRNQPM